MPTASKQFYTEQENINALRQIIAQLVERCIFTTPKSTETTLQQQLLQFLQISHRHAHNAASMCHECSDLISPFHQATLYINSKEVNADIKLELHNASHTPTLREFLRKKYNWDSKTIQLIDWEVHHHAIKTFKSTQRKTLLQVIHRWLPTNSHPALSNPLTSICPLCHIHLETNDHFLICTHEYYTKSWEADILIWHTKVQELNLDPILAYYIILTLTQLQLFTSIDNIEFCEGVYKKLYFEQNTIGWQQVLFGRLSTTWVDIQNDYLQESTSKGLTIISSITLLFQLILNRWKNRCHHQHGQCTLSNNNLREHILFPKVIQLYEDSAQLQANKQQYFNTSIEQILQKPTKALKQWIQRTEKFLSSAIRQTIITSTANTQPIHTFFHKKQHNNSKLSKHQQKQKSNTQKQTSSTKTIEIDSSTTSNQHTQVSIEIPNVTMQVPSPMSPKNLSINNLDISVDSLHQHHITKSKSTNTKIKRTSQSIRRRFTMSKRKNQPKRKKTSNKNIHVQHPLILPPPEPDPANLEVQLLSLLNKPP